MTETYDPNDNEKILRAAEFLLAQGHADSAEPIFQKVLQEAGNDTLEGALCLTNLAQIYEKKGDLRGAVDCSLRLIGHQQLYQQVPPFVKAAHAQRAADLLSAMGAPDDAEHFRKLANKIKETAPPPNSTLGTAGPVEQDQAWMLHALQNVAYQALHPIAKTHIAHQAPEPEAKAEAIAPPTPVYSSQSTAPINTTANVQVYKNRVDDMQFEEEETLNNDFSQETPDSYGTGPEKSGFNLQAFVLGLMGKKSPDLSDAPTHNRKAGRIDRSQPQRVRKPGNRGEREQSNGAAPRSVAQERSKPSKPKVGRSSVHANASMPQGANILEKLSGMFSSSAPKKPKTSNKYSEPQKLESSGAQASAGLINSVGALIAAGLVFVAVWNMAPRTGNPDLEFKNSPHKYKDASQSKLVWLASPYECEIETGPEKERMKLKYYFGDWRDTLTIMFGQVIDRFGYIQKGAYGLHDQDGTFLYDANSPELKLSDRMEEMMQEANDFFAEHKQYPTKLNDLKKIDWKYQNPFSKKKEQPEFTHSTLGSEKDDEGSDKLRPEFYAQLAAGDYWHKNYSSQPGGILCSSTEFASARGNIQSFVMTMRGANGEVLRLSDTQPAYYLASEDGRLKKVDVPKSHKYSTIWLTIKPIDSTLQFWLKEAASLFFLVASLFSLSIVLSMRRKDPAKGFWIFGTAVCAILSALYFGISHFR